MDDTGGYVSFYLLLLTFISTVQAAFPTAAPFPSEVPKNTPIVRIPAASGMCPTQEIPGTGHTGVMVAISGEHYNLLRGKKVVQEPRDWVVCFNPALVLKIMCAAPDPTVTVHLPSAFLKAWNVTGKASFRGVSPVKPREIITAIGGCPATPQQFGV